MIVEVAIVSLTYNLYLCYRYRTRAILAHLSWPRHLTVKTILFYFQYQRPQVTRTDRYGAHPLQVVSGFLNYLFTYLYL